MVDEVLRGDTACPVCAGAVAALGWSSELSSHLAGVRRAEPAQSVLLCLAPGTV